MRRFLAIGLGIALFGVHAAAFLPILRRASRAGDFSVALDPFRAQSGRLSATARIDPASVGERSRILCDGVPVGVGFDEAGVAEIRTGPLTPGVHQVCVEARYGGNRVRGVCRSTLVGPLQPPKSVAKAAIRIFLPEKMLSQLSEIAAHLLKKAIAERASFLKVRGTKVLLSLEAGGVRAKASVTLTDGTRADASVGIELGLSGRRPLLRRRGKTRVALRGAGAKAVGAMGASLGGAIGEALGDETGREIGRAIGEALASAAVDALLKWGVERLLDREVLPALADALTIPESIALGAEWGGAKLDIRYSGELRLEPGRGVSFALDVGLADRDDAARAAASRGWLGLEMRPPPMSKSGEVIVDVSPNLANLLLHGLWQNGRLEASANDRALLSEWDKRLADLVVRPAAVRFVLPPVVERARAGKGLDLVAAEVGLRLEPRAAETRLAAPIDARLLLRLGLGIDYEDKGRALAIRARLGDVVLTCLENGREGYLRPCFSDALRIAREELGGAQSLRLDLLRLPIDRLNPLAGPARSAALPVQLKIAQATPTLESGWIRLSMKARFE
jgi:hypothetical protein